MKKKLIAIAVAGAVMGSTAAMAEDMNSHVNVEGWADVIWKLAGETEVGGTSTDDLDEGQFSVPSAEVNFSTDYLVVDIHASDLDDLSLGQAYFMHDIMDGWKLHGGVFDSHLTADEGAAPDMEFTQNSLLFNVLDSVGGTSLTGLAVAGNVGPAMLTVAYANDESINPGEEGKNSIAVLLNAMPMEGLNLELGLLTQEDDPATSSGVGNIVDLNGTYAINGFTVGADFMTTGDPEDGEPDAGYSVWAGYNFGNGFNVKGRIENVSFEAGDDDLEATELYASYALSDNLSVALDIYTQELGDDSIDATLVEFIGTF